MSAAPAPANRPLISVGIATVGRAAKLARTLDACAALAAETPPFEVVVVVDGDDRASHEVLARPRPFPLRAFSQARRGPAAARNRTAREARGELVLFLNDDTRPEPGCLLAHAHAQRRFGPCMTAGLVSWDQSAPPTPYMRWLAPAGHQFNFARLRPGEIMPWDAVWAAHICLPAAWMADEPFDPGFAHVCLEDGEWSYRQYRRGRRAVYIPEAAALHDHRYDGPADFRSRARSFGSASRYVARRHPRLAWRLLARPVIAAAARLASLALPPCWRRETLWDLDFRLNVLIGLARPRADIR